MIVNRREIQLFSIRLNRKRSKVPNVRVYWVSKILCQVKHINGEIRSIIVSIKWF
jgi:hypothetical protein